MRGRDPRMRVETFPHDFRTQILLSALGLRFIYTRIHVHIFSYVSPFIEEQTRNAIERIFLSLERERERRQLSAYPDTLHFDKRRAAGGQTIL